MIPLKKIASIAADLVCSNNMIEFKILGKCNIQKKIYLIKNLNKKQ